MQNVKSKKRIAHVVLFLDFSFCILHFAFAASRSAARGVLVAAGNG
jgi:hypothetical protein